MATAYPFPIPAGMYGEQRVRLSKQLGALGADHAALLQGAAEVPVNSSDTNYIFRQESYFEYLFGCSIPDCFGAVLSNGHSILFIPRLPPGYAVWLGELPNPDKLVVEHGVHQVAYTDEIAPVLKSHGVQVLHVMEGVNSDSGLNVLRAKFDGMEEAFRVETDFLFHALSTQRTVKTSLEAQVLKYVCRVSSNAHIYVMQHCRPGMSQHQLESNFLHHVYYHGGCRRVSYTCICATGHYGAVLHYPNNDAPVLDGSMALLDMGGEYRCYASDITCSFPANGKFTDDQRAIYDTVLDAHNRVLHTMKAGVSWVELHTLALHVMCKHLLALGILRNGTVDELMDKEIMAVFQPHGMGHLIGLDVHDVGGYLADAPPRPTRSDCCKLRTARELKAGFYVTVEPGCYFNRVLLENAFADDSRKEYFNEELIRSRFWSFGGVRIESDVLVTSSGAVNFTVVPRTVEEIERTMAGAPFVGEVQEYHNQVK